MNYLIFMNNKYNPHIETEGQSQPEGGTISPLYGEYV